ncbi:MAG: site-specific integrase [Gemmataceae bacterium]|nr:site-specific integrase [Gemmataceae bacterium]
MSRPRKSVPSYLLHQQSGRARIAVSDHLGRPKQIMLPGDFDSPQSLTEYERLLGLLRANGGRLPPPSSGADLTVHELVLAYMERKVEAEYVDADGSPTGEQECQREAIRPLLRLYGSIPAKIFGSLELKAIQKAMANGAWLTFEECETRRKHKRPIGWCRARINRNMGRVRALFRWAVSEKLATPMQLVELQSVEPMKRGRGVRETEPVLPVDPHAVEETLGTMPPHIRDMVLFQLRTGARPGEVCAMRFRDIDKSGDVWVYRPRTHKTAHRGHVRAIAIGPKAQDAIRRHLDFAASDEHVFSPRRQQAEINAARRALRKSSVQPSQIDRSKGTPLRQPATRFSSHAYARAIARACKKAGVPHWHPHQLRHTAALLIERDQGAEAARATLGHRTLNMTLHYAGIDLRRAAEVAAKMG